MLGLENNSKTNRAGKARKPGFYQKIFDGYFQPMTLGRLTATLADGSVRRYGFGVGNVNANIKVLNNGFFKKCVLFGDVGFGESYVDGDWETDDITSVIEWMCLNVESHPILMGDHGAKSKFIWLKWANNVLKWFHNNTPNGSRKNIAAHYDLSNDFFSAFLDPTMTYSSAYFESDGLGLQEAQIRKYQRLCRKLAIKASDHVLEIGGGWGGFAVYAAKNFGCRVTTITISKEQFDFARKRFEDEGLAGKVDIRLVDYRKMEGIFDKIVSIEMIEAVGPQYYDTFFRKCHRLLKKDGLLGLQMILSPDHRYASFKKNMDWIQKHIFPGSLLPSLSVIMRSINRTGTLNLYDYKDITQDYGRTLMIWQEKFRRNVGRVRALGFDETFIRKWDYYFSYCAGAFNMRNISVAQAVFTRANNLTLRSVRG